jgi:hypothetical protein
MVRGSARHISSSSNSSKQDTAVVVYAWIADSQQGIAHGGAACAIATLCNSRWLAAALGPAVNKRQTEMLMHAAAGGPTAFINDSSCCRYGFVSSSSSRLSH